MRRCLACDALFTGNSWDCPECRWAPTGNGLPRFAPDLAASSDHFPLESVARMAELEERHFWFRARSDLVVSLITQYFPAAQSVLELGCGTGSVLSRLHAAFPDIAIAGGDLSEEALAVARRRVRTGTFAQLDIRDVPYDSEFDVVCLLDVLEHVDEDDEALFQATRAVRPGGGVVVSVPQHRWLWSAMDDYGRHRRRYTRARAEALFRQAGLDLIRTTSFMSLLLPAVAASRVTHRRVTNAYDPFRELDLPSLVNRVCSSIMAVETQLIRRGISFRAGASLLLAGRKK